MSKINTCPCLYQIKKNVTIRYAQNKIIIEICFFFLSRKMNNVKRKLDISLKFNVKES